MHIALRTDDVLFEIFKHLRDYTPTEEFVYRGRRKDNRTPYYAALTCKQFLPHALDALWFSMDTLSPLTKIIPEVKRDSRDNLYLADALLSADNLGAFDRYAHRIHCYNLHSVSDTNDLSNPVISALMQALDRPHLLPNLRTLLINELAQGCCHLCSPSLKCVKISDATDATISYCLPLLSRLSPSLLELRVNSPTVPAQLLQFKKLQRLRTNTDFILSSDTTIPSPPFSKSLQVWSATTIATRGENPVDFPALTALELYGHVDVKEVSRLVSHGSMPLLDTLSFYSKRYGDANSNASYKTLFSTLFRHQDRCLRILEIDMSNSRPFDEPDQVSIGLDNMLEDSSPGQPLQMLTLYDIPFDLSLDYPSIHALGATFPQLTHLTLPRYSNMLIPFDNLAVLASFLPHLVRLDISIDGRTLADPPSVPSLSHQLQMLSLTSSRISEPSLFASYIHRLFPFVKIEQHGLVPTGGSDVAAALNLLQS